MKGVLTAAGRRACSGLTLVEILATVFILGLGLIMVAAAFPVGLDQVRQSVEDTQSAMAARSAMEIMRSQNIFENMRNLAKGDSNFNTVMNSIASGTKEERRRENLGIMTTESPCQALHLNHSDFAFRVWNPYRMAYGAEILAEDETVVNRNLTGSFARDEDNKSRTFGQTMWPPVPGDLVWRAFITRLNFGKEELPLFRVTIVICRYSAVGQELLVSKNSTAGITGNTWDIEVSSLTGTQHTKALPSARTVTVDGYSNRVCTAQSGQVERLAEGNFLLNPKTGFCHRIMEIHKQNQNFTLADDAEKSPAKETCPVFSSVVGIYYGMLSG